MMSLFILPLLPLGWLSIPIIPAPEVDRIIPLGVVPNDYWW